MPSDLASYVLGDDAGASCYGEIMYAQTFATKYTHDLTKAVLKGGYNGIPGGLYYWILPIDDAGLPTWPPLASGSIPKEDVPHYAGDGSPWIDLPFPDTVRLQAWTTYALAILYPETPGYPNDFVWRYDGSAPTYARGGYYYSVDNGRTWNDTHSLTRDFMFQIWGVIAPPALFNWAITYYGHYWTDDVLTIFVTTDVPCHLNLYQTGIRQRIHLRTKPKRGLTTLNDPKYCFVEPSTINQNEDGDTLEHTFTWPSWALNMFRQWYYDATSQGIPTTINSATFQAIGFRQERAFTMKHTDLTHKETAGILDHANASISPVKLIHPFTFPLFPLTPSAAPTEDYQVANKKYVDDQPAALTFHWDDTQTVIFVATDVTSTLPWLTIDLDTWCGTNVVLVHLQLLMIVGQMSAGGRAGLRVRKYNTSPTYNPTVECAYNQGDALGARKEPSVVCGVGDGRYIQRQVTITGTCKVNVGIILQGWWD